MVDTYPVFLHYLLRIFPRMVFSYMTTHFCVKIINNCYWHATSFQRSVTKASLVMKRTEAKARLLEVQKPFFYIKTNILNKANVDKLIIHFQPLISNN